MKKRYIFDLKIEGQQKSTEVPIIAKNMQSAIAKLTADDYYNEDQIINVSIFKKE